MLDAGSFSQLANPAIVRPENVIVPQISRFYGIIVAMYYNDHAPPHFHAKYAGRDVSIGIESGKIMDGGLSNRALQLAEEWRRLHERELMNNWELARSRHPLIPIEPLE